MIVTKSKYQKWTVVIGLLFLILYFFQDVLYEKMWLFPSILMWLFELLLIILFTIAIIKRDKRVIQILIFVGLIILVTKILKSEIFKSQKVLVAVLNDALSKTYLTLRKNNTFEIDAVTIFSDQKFKGKYKLINDKIIFLDKPYDNDFIPDTMTILKDKLILRFKNNGEPVIDFATYFDIKQNNLRKDY